MCKIAKFKAFVFSVVMMMFLVVQADAATIYSSGDNGTTLITIDTATGAATLVGPSGYSETWAAAFTPDGTLWTILNGWTDGQLATFNLSTGAATAVGTPMGTTDVMALEADSAGTIYAAGWDGSFYTVNQTTGQITLVGNMGFIEIMDMAFDNSGTLWAVANDAATNDLYTINPATGTGTFICTLSVVTWNMGLMVDPATNIMYGTNWTDPAYLYQIDPATCVATQIGTGLGIPYPHGGDILPQAVAAPTAIPTMNEWGMIIFMVLAGLGSVYYMRRQKRIGHSA